MNDNFKVLKENHFQSRISFNPEFLRATKMPFKIEREINTYWDKQKIRATRPEKLKEVLSAEGMWLSGKNLDTKKWRALEME